MPQYLQSIHGALWGAPALMMILGVGMYLSIRTEFAQIRLFPHARILSEAAKQKGF